MPAFSERESLTGSLSYLRQQAQRLGYNPCFDHVPVETVMGMNEKGRDGQLFCPGYDCTCPCEMLKHGGECDPGVFRRL